MNFTSEYKALQERYHVQRPDYGISGNRFVARDWDTTLSQAEAAERVRAPAAWPTLAEGAQAKRGVAI